MSKEIESAVDAFLLEKAVTFTAKFVGATTRDKWECDAWKVSFTKADKSVYETDYFTGIGHRAVPTIQKHNYKRELENHHSSWRNEITAKYAKPVAPCAASVLYGLTRDADAIEYSFDDWAADMGIDTDSRKGLETFLQCQKIGHEMNKFFGRDGVATLRELLQDY